MSHDMNAPHPALGFSLIELMVTVAVLGVLATMVAPSFVALMARQDIRSLSSDLSSDLAVARAEAARAGATSIVCSSPGGNGCGGGGYDVGWIVAVDFNRDGAVSANEIVRRHGAGAQGVTVVTGDGASTSSFSPNGRLDAPRQFTICKTGVRGSIIDVLGSGVFNVYQTPVDCT